MIYGYARISRKEQSIDRQIRNIKAEYSAAVIFQEAYTGTKMDRPEWNKLFKKVKAGDVIVFDSVSRMSRTAAEGVETYFELYERDVQLVFLRNTTLIPMYMLIICVTRLSFRAAMKTKYLRD